MGWQGLARRVKMSHLGWYWVQQAGGCNSCQGDDLEDPCYGDCISSNLDAVTLINSPTMLLQTFKISQTMASQTQTFKAYSLGGTIPSASISPVETVPMERKLTFGIAMDLSIKHGTGNTART